jgi:hypothetical protein
MITKRYQLPLDDDDDNNNFYDSRNSSSVHVHVVNINLLNFNTIDRERVAFELVRPDSGC